MRKLVILYFLEGNFEQGFPAILQIGKDSNLFPGFSQIREDGMHDVTQITGRLPPSPQMPERFREWREAFHIQVASSMSSNGRTRIRPKKAGMTNFSYSEVVSDFVDYMNNWLKSGYREWQDIRDGLQQRLSADDEIRVIIQTTDSLLRRLPWQAWKLFAQDYNKAEIALSPSKFKAPVPLPPTPAQSKVRILAVFGENTISGSEQKIDIQFDQTQLKRLQVYGAEIQVLQQPTAEKLRECLWQKPGWHIFFFAGHSSSEADGQIGWIDLNSTTSLAIEDFQEALKVSIVNGLQLAIFNSCDGLGLANQLAELNIRQIIVMREPVPDKVAQGFLQHFLTAFACHNQSLYTSVREARARLEDWEEQFPGAKWMPVICQHPAVVPPTWNQLHGRMIDSIASEWDAAFTQQELGNRRDLLAQVKNEVMSRLSQSLHQAVLINLYKQNQPQQVKRPWDVEVKVGNQPAVQGLSNSEIIEIFDQEAIAGKLLILGAPGSGKTTTMLELARQLVVRAEYQINEPIPILFNLSSWKDDRKPITEWLVAELNSKYGVRAVLGKQWLENRQLLPLLDGLDELKPKLQKSCVRAINQFLQGEYRPRYLVVCSRLEEYAIHQTFLQLNGAICLQPLNHQQIQNYLTTVNHIELWQQTISSDSNLLELVQTPLLLSITVLSYEQISLSEWQELASTEERFQYLLNAYVRRMSMRPIHHSFDFQHQPYTFRQIQTWLIWLAQMLQKESETEFLIEKIQPSCLQTGMQKLVYSLSVTLVILLIALLSITPIVMPFLGLTFGTIFSLIVGLIIRLGKYIETVENLGWSLKRAINGLGMGLILGLLIELSRQLGITLIFILMILGLIIKLFSSLSHGLNTGLNSILTSVFLTVFSLFLMIIMGSGLDIGLIVGLVVGLGAGLTSLDIETKTIPNQGIWKSAANARNAGLILGLTFGLAVWLITGKFEPKNQINLGLAGLLFGNIFGGLIYGGKACIQHFILRLILYYHGYIPWNYAHFLDYATQCLFLQRVGGRYRFIHKLLQEYFASLMPIS